MECPESITILSETANTIELLYPERHYWDLGFMIFSFFFSIKVCYELISSLNSDKTDKSKVKNSKIGCVTPFLLLFFIFLCRVTVPKS